MLDSFAEMLSISPYKDNFVIKGGFYLSTKTVFDNRNLAVRHNDILDLIEANENIHHLWSNYSMKHSFAEEIKFDDVFTCIRDLCREIGLI